MSGLVCIDVNLGTFIQFNVRPYFLLIKKKFFVKDIMYGLIGLNICKKKKKMGFFADSVCEVLIVAYNHGTCIRW